ncbi:KEOPS complex component, partial [Halobacteriales archaeon QH_10_67_13]
MELVEGTATIRSVDSFLDELAAIGEAHDAVVQAVDARYVVDRRHLELATELARRERARGSGIARDPGVEILLYAAGRRQINRALEMGVSEGTEQPLAVVVSGGEESTAAEEVREKLAPAEALGEYDR